jgi:hypothetical protein
MHQQEVLLVHLVCRDTDNDLLISLSVHKVANWLFSVLGFTQLKASSPTAQCRPKG